MIEETILFISESEYWYEKCVSAIMCRRGSVFTRMLERASSNADGMQMEMRVKSKYENSTLVSIFDKKNWSHNQ